MWVTAATVVAATGAIDLKLVLVALGAIVTTALLLMLVQTMPTAGKCLMGIGILAFGALAVVTGAPVIGAAFATGWLLPLAIPLIGLPLVISAFFWIAAPTREGRTLCVNSAICDRWFERRGDAAAAAVSLPEYEAARQRLIARQVRERRKGRRRGAAS